MKYRSIVLLTCVYTLSPSPYDGSAADGVKAAHSASSSSVYNHTKPGLGTIPENQVDTIRQFLGLMRILTPTDAAGAREVVRLITEGESFAILRDISPVSRGVGECFECAEIRGQLDAAVKEAIQILNDNTERMCNMQHQWFRTKIDSMIRKISISTDPSEKAQAFSDLAQNLESLADAYKLLIKGSCEDPLDTKLKLACALEAASVALHSVGLSHTRARSHTDAAQAHEKCATLEQERAKIYGALGDREMERAKICGALGDREMERAGALKDAASALSSALRSHARAGNHAGVTKAREKSAALLREAADIIRNARTGTQCCGKRARGCSIQTTHPQQRPMKNTLL